MTMQKEMWFKDDPRFRVNKRAKIVVLFPDSTGYHRGAIIGEVDTKEGWYIGLANYDLDTSNFRSSIHADEDWPEGWLWTWHP